MNGPALLTIDAVWKHFPGEDRPFEVLRGASMTLRSGETAALTGESGSGKSTLLHLAAGLDTPNKGNILLDGRNLAAMSDRARAQTRRSRIGIVFQQFNLIPSLRVGENIAFQARLAGQHDPEWCATLAQRLGLADHLRKFPEQLSGGQQQRVAIGRALAPRPALVLADEPTGNLDEASSDAVLALMLDLVAETGAGLLMVTHSSRIAGKMGRALRLTGGVVDAGAAS